MIPYSNRFEGCRVVYEMCPFAELFYGARGIVRAAALAPFSKLSVARSPSSLLWDEAALRIIIF
eukprot:scaffold12966_cov78-Skeletonema_dohrnii-CCMP3373.AAC.3